MLPAAQVSAQPSKSPRIEATSFDQLPGLQLHVIADAAKTVLLPELPAKRELSRVDTASKVGPDS